MTKTLTILLIFFSTICFGQGSNSDLLKDNHELTFVNLVSFQDVFDGFYICNGFCSDIFHLDSNMTFQKTRGCDIGGRSTIDSGLWRIENNLIIIESKKETLNFCVIKFDKYYFFLLQDQRQKFVADFQLAKKQVTNFKWLKSGDPDFTSNDLIQASLSNRYYVKELADSTGT